MPDAMSGILLYNSPMTYLLPAIIEPPDYIKICVTIPNRPEYIDAFLGSYNYLGRWTAWKQDGTTRARDAARVWLAAIQDTISRWEACGEEDMTTIVNNYVNCGCGGGIPTTIICYGQDGQPVITPQPPVEPTTPNPVGDEWPVNPEADTVPDGFGDWTEFDVEACAAANGVWQAAYFMVVLAEGAIDLIATILVIAAFVVAELPAIITAVISGSGLLKYAEGLVRILLSEQAADVLIDIREWLENDKDEIICTIFQYRHDIPGMQFRLVRMMHAHIFLTLTLDLEEETAVTEFGRSIFPLNLLLAYFFEYQRYIEANDPVICSTCSLESNIQFMNFGGTSFKKNGVDVDITVPGSHAGDFLEYGATYTIESASSSGYPWFDMHQAQFLLYQAESENQDVIMQVMAVSGYVAPSSPYPSGFPTDGFKLRLANQSNLNDYFGQEFDGLAIELGNQQSATQFQFAGAADATNFIITFKFWPI